MIAAIVVVAAPIGAQEATLSALLAKAEAFVDTLVSEQFAKAVGEFDAAMKASLTEEQLRNGWQAIVKQSGPFKQRISARVEPRSSIMAVVVTCQFEKVRHDVHLFYNSAGLVSGLSIRPSTWVEYTTPPYVTPSAFSEREVTVTTGEWRLPGTLTIPKASARGPGVVLVHGSGPLDRDATVGAVKPFRDLALGLATQGITVLRYEKRSRVYGQKLNALSNLTVRDEVIDDVVSAVEVLRQEPTVDPARIVVIGHSLGGMMVPRIAAAETRVAGFVVMAGPARPLEELILQQVKYQASADGSILPAEQTQIDAVQRLVDAVRALDPAAPATQSIGGVPASYWLDLKGYDPAAAAAAVSRPLFVIQGERDYQVTMDDFARWKAALGSKAATSLRSYPGLNHLFVEGIGPSLPIEYLTPGHVADAVVRDLGVWILSLKG